MGRAIADRWVIFMTLLQHNLKVQVNVQGTTMVPECFNSR
jgi:hypothetical protein